MWPDVTITNEEAADGLCGSGQAMPHGFALPTLRKLDQVPQPLRDNSKPFPFSPFSQSLPRVPMADVRLGYRRRVNLHS